MPYRLDWRGDALLAKERQGAIRGLSEVGQHIEGGAKAELFPGHGVITGTLRRGIAAEPASAVSATVVRVRVAVQGVPYAVFVERLYRFLRRGWEKAQPSARSRVVAAIREAMQ